MIGSFRTDSVAHLGPDCASGPSRQSDVCRRRVHNRERDASSDAVPSGPETQGNPRHSPSASGLVTDRVAPRTGSTRATVRHGLSGELQRLGARGDPPPRDRGHSDRCLRRHANVGERCAARNSSATAGTAGKEPLDRKPHLYPGLRRPRARPAWTKCGAEPGQSRRVFRRNSRLLELGNTLPDLSRHPCYRKQILVMHSLKLSSPLRMSISTRRK